MSIAAGNTYTIDAIRAKLYNTDQERSEIINDTTTYLDRELDYNKCIEIMESIKNLDERRAEETGKPVNYSKLSGLDKIMWIAREAYRLGAAYGIDLMATAVNAEIDDLGKGAE